MDSTFGNLPPLLECLQQKKGTEGRKCLQSPRHEEHGAGRGRKFCKTGTQGFSGLGIRAQSGESRQKMGEKCCLC